jgi:formylglycine-generating enzyme required for sulfatase activity
MVNVTWNDAAAFCRWAGGRLPGEAEWEYAARGGSTEARYGPVDEIAWYAGDSGGERLDNTTQLWNAGEQAYYRRLLANDNRLHEVGLKRGNGFGLFDMLGSALEWVSDWYDEHYYQSSPSEDPTGPASGQARILRGGAWDSPAAHVRASIRHGRPPNNYWFSFSFRCGGDVFGP